MSWFSWIFRRQAGAAKPAQPAVRLKDRRSRSKASPGAKGGPSKPQHLRRKEDRAAHRDLLHAVVREAMMGAGVLSAHYKFKILSVDQEGQQFLVMVDLASGFGADMGRLGAMEAAIIQRAHSQRGLQIMAVYWRFNGQPGAFKPAKPAAQQGVTTTAPQSRGHTQPTAKSAAASGFADTEMPDADGPAKVLGQTQYGEPR